MSPSWESEWEMGDDLKNNQAWEKKFIFASIKKVQCDILLYWREYNRCHLITKQIVFLVFLQLWFIEIFYTDIVLY